MTLRERHQTDGRPPMSRPDLARLAKEQRDGVSPVTAPPVPLHERPEIHARRWFLLGIMCLSLVLVVMSVSGLNTALPTIQRDLDAVGVRAPVDRRRLRARVRRPAADRRRDRRPLRPQGARCSAASRCSALGALVGGLRQQLDAGDRRPGGDGHRRRVRHAGDAVASSRRSSRRTSARKAIAIWAGFAGAGGVARPDRHRRRCWRASGGVRRCS